MKARGEGAGVVSRGRSTGGATLCDARACSGFAGHHLPCTNSAVATYSAATYSASISFVATPVPQRDNRIIQ